MRSPSVSMASSSSTDDRAGCCCRKWPRSSDGIARRSSSKPASKPACRARHGEQTPASWSSKRTSLPTALQRRPADARMDNLCHTLVGAALGEAGLERRTRFGHATVEIASTLPDIDVLVFATGTPSVAFRRGWTHGILADALLPPLLTAVMLLVASRRTTTSTQPSVKPMQLLLLSYVGVILHVVMDLLNTYGVRLLMPFSQQWFYGDVLFIIGPWLWLALATGVSLSIRRRAPNWSRVSLAIAAT